MSQGFEDPTTSRSSSQRGRAAVIARRLARAAAARIPSPRAARLRRRVARQKEAARQQSYRESPRVSLVVQFFNKQQNIDALERALRRSGADELIVLDDGSIDGSHEAWVAKLTRPNDFLVRSNDLFEVRTYDRALGMARGDLVVLLQDDDLPPPDEGWLSDAVALFEAVPELLVLGGRDGIEVLRPLEPAPGAKPGYQRQGDIAGAPGVQRYRIIETVGCVEPETGLPLEYVQTVNRAPMIVRRCEVLALGGIEQSFAPYQCDDIDLCIRAWKAGWRVGLYECRFDRDVGGGGMRSYNSSEVPQQARRNWKRVYDRHGLDIESEKLQRMVSVANESLTSRS